MYGLRDASAAFDKKVETVMENLRYRVGLINPSLCYSESERVGVFQFGDDLVAVGTRSQTVNFRDELGKELIVMCRGVLGSSKDVGDCSAVVVLNRIVPWVVGRQVRETELRWSQMHVMFPSWLSSLVGTARVDQLRHLEFAWWNHVVMSWTRIVERQTSQQ